MLCGRHNFALSELDERAGRLFRTFRAIESDLRGGVGGRQVRLFAGIDVERWMLKVLIGLVCSGNARTIDGEPFPGAVPEHWLKILFGESTFPPTWGLYMLGRIGDGMRLDPGHVAIAPLTTDRLISGLQAEVAGVRLVLVMRDIGGGRTGALDDLSIHRPNELLIVDPTSGCERSVCFAWSEGQAGGQYPFRLDWLPPDKKTRVG